MQIHTVTLQFDPKAWAAISNLAARCCPNVNPEIAITLTVQRAIATYDMLRTHVDQGGEVHLISPGKAPEGMLLN